MRLFTYETRLSRLMAGMRDKLIHFYFGVDMEIVWETVKVRIAELEPLIEDALNDLEQQ